MRYIGPIILLVAVLALVASAAAEAKGATPDPCPVQYEDEAGWDWTVCGNGLRGVVTMHGTPVVVSVERFCRMTLRGSLRRWPMTGDPTRWQCRHRVLTLRAIRGRV